MNKHSYSDLFASIAIVFFIVAVAMIQIGGIVALIEETNHITTAGWFGISALGSILLALDALSVAVLIDEPVKKSKS